MSELICPFMSCRLIDGKNTPVIVKCQKESCAIYDHEHKCCVLIGLKIEAVNHDKN